MEAHFEVSAAALFPCYTYLATQRLTLARPNEPLALSSKALFLYKARYWASPAQQTADKSANIAAFGNMTNPREIRFAE